MKKRILFFFCILNLSAHSQSWDLVKNYSFDASDWGNSMGLDQQKNIYITGNSNYFTGGGGSRMHEWIAKFDSVGNLLWRDTIPYTYNRLVTAANGDCFIAGGNKICKYSTNGIKQWDVTVPIYGYFSGIDFNSNGIIVLGHDSSKSVLGKYDLNGNLLWWKKGFFPLANKILSDRQNNIYIIGTGSTDNSTINFGLLTKCDSNGNLISSQTIPHTPTDIEVDASGNIFITGWFANQPIEISGNTYSAGEKKQYLIKYDASGNIIWHRVYKGPSVICLDENQNLIVATSYGENIPAINAPAGNLIVYGIDDEGNTTWYKNSLFTNTPGYLQGYIESNDIKVKNNEVLITGAILANHTLDTYSLSTNSDYSDLFLAKIAQNEVIGIEEISNDLTLNVSIFPNPTEGVFKIACSATERCSLQLNIFSIRGEKIFSESISNSNEFVKTIDLSKNAKGTYLVEILADKKRVVKKIVID